MTSDETRPDRDALREIGRLRNKVRDLEPALAQRDAEIERLRRRIWPDQGHGYANEVERQRYVIENLQRIARKAKDERDEARRVIAAVEALCDERDRQKHVMRHALRAALAGDQP